MNTIAISVSRLRLTFRSGWVERPLQFISLAKPCVMALSLFTAFVGLIVAPICPEPLPGFFAIPAVAVAAGAAGALNMWFAPSLRWACT
jgi:heme O synthase-like polyprenyltransferase